MAGRHPHGRLCRQAALLVFLAAAAGADVVAADLGCATRIGCDRCVMMMPLVIVVVVILMIMAAAAGIVGLGVNVPCRKIVLGMSGCRRLLERWCGSKRISGHGQVS